jgi:hypothetical protein
MNETNKTSGYPDDNPKTVLGVQKTPLHLVPPSAKYHLAAAFADGAVKYGPYNWRDKTVSSSVYVAAAQRHLDDWWDGEDLSRDAKVNHLAHVMACCAILLDAESIGMLNDDRPTAGAATDLHEEFAENKKKEKDAEIPNGGYDLGPSAASIESRYFPGPTIEDSLEYRRVPDLQANVLPSDLTGWWYRGFDGTHEYWQRPDGGVARYDSAHSGRVSQPTVSELFSGGGTPFNSLYDLTERNSSGEISVATWDGDGGPTWTNESPELRLYDDRLTGAPFYMGNGCVDVGKRSGGKPST